MCYVARKRLKVNGLLDAHVRLRHVAKYHMTHMRVRGSERVKERITAAVETTDEEILRRTWTEI